MLKCTDCISLGFCHRIQARLVTDRELTPAFIRDLRDFTAALPVNFRQFRDYLYNEYRDFPGRVIGAGGKETFLDMEVFEVPNIEYWFRDFACSPCPAHVTPHVRKEARERVRVMATILRARNPKAAMLWGRMDAANDNDPA